MCILQRKQRIMISCNCIYGCWKEACFRADAIYVIFKPSASCAGSDHDNLPGRRAPTSYFSSWYQVMWNLCLHSARHLSRTASNYPRHGFSRQLSSISGAAIPKPKSLHPPRRPRKLVRRIGFTLVGLGTVYVVDKTYNASSVSRNLRTLWTVRHHT